MLNTRFILGAGAGAVALCLASISAASPGDAGCAIPSGGAQVNDDDCTQAGTPAYDDPNGGCNFASGAHQDLGSMAPGGSIEVTGTVGTFIPNGGTTYTSRDLDWYEFTLTGGANVTFTLNMDNYLDEGGAVGFVDSVLFIGEGSDCPATTFYALAGNSCSHVAGPFLLAAGTYRVIVTTPFEVNAGAGDSFYQCPAQYDLNITSTTETWYADCDVANGACDEVHGTGGCDDFSCCATVCFWQPNCCSVEWDALCVDDTVNGLGAVQLCGYFVYSCPAPGPQSNDCATSATLVEPGDTVAFDNTDATTDGPNGASSLCAGDMGLDLWYLIKAPADGQLTVNGCGLNGDSIMGIYDVGLSAAFDPALLNIVPSACADDTCGVVGGPTILTIVNAEADHYYAVRIGSWFDDANPAVAIQGDVTFSFAQVIFNTGVQKNVLQGAAGVNLGLSSGNVSATLTQRWCATPFTVPAVPGVAGAGGTWTVTQILGKGFVPGATAYYPGTITGIGWVIWKRLPGNPAPVAADQVAAGVVPTPVNYDDANDSAADASWPINLASGPELEPGDYYLTIYGDNGGPAVPANWAWFIYAQSGLYLTEGGLHGWRKSTIAGNFATPYTGLNGVYTVQAADDPNALYTNAFVVLGIPNPPAPPVCTPGPDRNGDGCVNGADLGLVIAGWDPTGSIGNGFGPGDVNCNGVVDGADVGLILAGWQPVCP